MEFQVGMSLSVEIFQLSEKVSCSLIRRKGLRRVSLSVTESGEVRLSVPLRARLDDAKSFAKEKEDWILRTIKKQSFRPKLEINEPYQVLRSRAQALVADRMPYFCALYGVTPRAVSIGVYKSRWGACRRDGRICFDYRIASLAQEEVDYLIAHELSHMLEFNHSRNFWDLVRRGSPEFSNIRKKLRLLIRKNSDAV